MTVACTEGLTETITLDSGSLNSQITEGSIVNIDVDEVPELIIPCWDNIKILTLFEADFIKRKEALVSNLASAACALISDEKAETVTEEEALNEFIIDDLRDNATELKTVDKVLSMLAKVLEPFKPQIGKPMK